MKLFKITDNWHSRHSNTWMNKWMNDWYDIKNAKEDEVEPTAEMHIRYKNKLVLQVVKYQDKLFNNWN